MADIYMTVQSQRNLCASIQSRLRQSTDTVMQLPFYNVSNAVRTILFNIGIRYVKNLFPRRIN